MTNTSTNRFRETVDRELESVQLSDDVKMHVLNSRYARTAPSRRFTLKPLAVAVASVCTVSALTVGVGAVACGGVSEFIGGVSVVLQPVNETCTSNGIRVTVLSAGVDSVESKTMSAYVTLEDTTGQGRVTEDSEFQCWVRSDGERVDDENARVDCTMVSYDEDSRVATYRVVATMDWWNRFANKNTLYSNGIYDGTTVETTVTEGVDLSALVQGLDAGYSYYDTDDHGYTTGYYGCYTGSTSPDTRYRTVADLAEPVQLDDDTQLVGVGFVDGHLHVRLEYGNYYELAYHPEGLDASEYTSLGGVTLVDGDGVDSTDTAEYYSSITEGDRDSYTQVVEVCFPRVRDVATLEGMNLSYGVETSTTVEGSWSVTFKVDDATTD